MTEQNEIQTERTKWFQIRYFYVVLKKDVLDDHNRFLREVRNREMVDYRILNWFENEIKDDELWHIRWGIKDNQEFLCVRTCPHDKRKKDLQERALQLGKELVREGILHDTKGDDVTWWQSDQKWPSHCRSYDEWKQLAKLLHLLSKVALVLHGMNPDRRQFFFYEKVIHHLHNMMHIQDSFRPTDLGIKGAFSRSLLMNLPWVQIGKGVVQWNPGYDQGYEEESNRD